VPTFDVVTHIDLTMRLTGIIRRVSAGDVARLGFILVMTHPTYGVDAQRAFAAFARVVVTVIIEDNNKQKK
jgi:hypothetical protein